MASSSAVTSMFRYTSVHPHINSHKKWECLRRATSFVPPYLVLSIVPPPTGFKGYTAAFHIYTNTNTQRYIYTHVHTYTHTSIHLYTHTHIQIHTCTNTQFYKHTNIGLYEHTIQHIINIHTSMTTNINITNWPRYSAY